MRYDSRGTNQLPISVVILTWNEEDTVTGAITSAIVNYAEVIVLDSFSNDRTVELAEAAGARVVCKAFEGYASQRNFALHVMEKTMDWVLFLDADERILPELTAELMRDFARQAGTVGMFYMRRKDIFEGRWIKRSSGYPTWFGRLCHAPSVRVEREINEEYHCVRATSRLKEHLIHYPFAKGVTHWIDRHNRYSTAEAAAKAQGIADDSHHLLSRDPGLRRKGLKQIYMRLPFRPLVGFTYLYFVRGGFLDGRAGLRFAMLRAFYELMISIKLAEIRAARESI